MKKYLVISNGTEFLVAAEPLREHLFRVTMNGTSHEIDIRQCTSDSLSLLMDDLRVLELLLALPILPWCWRKNILREAAKGLLPASVVERPKTFFPGDPIAIHLRAGASLPELDGPSHPRLARFLEGRRPDPRTWLERAAIPWDEVRPLCLDLWLRDVL